MAKILLVEDEPVLAKVVEEWLVLEKHAVDLLSSGADGLDWLRLKQYDLAVLDWGLPSLSGLEVCRQYRHEGGTTPILLLTGKRSVQEKKIGLDAGADDYLTKPFELEELSARIRALVRRQPALDDRVLRRADVEFDTVNYTVRKAGREVRLSRKELAILELLMLHPNRVFAPLAIIEHVWRGEDNPKPEVVRIYIQKIRAAIDDPDASRSLIRNKPGIGYSLEL